MPTGAETKTRPKGGQRGLRDRREEEDRRDQPPKPTLSPSSFPPHEGVLGKGEACRGGGQKQKFSFGERGGNLRNGRE